MTPLQANMLSNTLAMIASIVAAEFVDVPNFDPHRFQQSVAKECRKCFLSQLTSFKLITPDPPKPPTTLTPN